MSEVTTPFPHKRLMLTGPTSVYIDWANVYGWRYQLPFNLTPGHIHQLFRSYPTIKKTCFYFGTDFHPASSHFLNSVRKLGFSVYTKPVKYINLRDSKKTFRKCDFDVEITLDVLQDLKLFHCFIFFSGDGDFDSLPTISGNG